MVSSTAAHKMLFVRYSLVFFLNDPPTTDIYTLSLHDALPIYPLLLPRPQPARHAVRHPGRARRGAPEQDRKSTRLNSSHQINSYAVFCLKKKTSGMKLKFHYNTFHQLIAEPLRGGKFVPDSYA